MRKTTIVGLLLALTTGAVAQDEHGYGAPDGDIKSLSEEVLGLKKHNDMLNIYFNYSFSYQEQQNSQDDEWQGAFKVKQLRLEIKGNLTDKLYYRFRHRLNKSHAVQNQDNFLKATDFMMVGYHVNDKLSVEAGKMCQMWGGFEFDENVAYIYQFSDMVDNMDHFHSGVTVSYKPVESQELVLQVTNANNAKLEEEYGEGAVSIEGDGSSYRKLEKANHPLTYILNWNGSFLNGKLKTRWSWGSQNIAKHKYSNYLFLGQQLCLPRVQWYFDYMGAWDGLDRLKIASNELELPSALTELGGLGGSTGEANVPYYFSNVHYNSFITKLNWQFAPQWNLMLKGMYETASVSKIAAYKNYRKSFGYFAAIEYYPVKSQDLRIMLSYIGRKYDYSDRVSLQDYNTNRIELGFMCRLKVF